MDIKDQMKEYQCECQARSVVVWEGSDGMWHCRCASCGRVEEGFTSDQAIRNWQDARDMDVIDGFYKEGK
jgi:hypothetical protein